MKWKHFPRNWPFVRGIHRSPVNSPHKGQWRGALMFSLLFSLLLCKVPRDQYFSYLFFFYVFRPGMSNLVSRCQSKKTHRVYKDVTTDMKPYLSYTWYAVKTTKIWQLLLNKKSIKSPMFSDKDLGYTNYGVIEGGPEYQSRFRLLSSYPWWRHQMETFSLLLAICAGNSPVPCEFPAQRPVTRSFDVFFDLRLNKRLRNQSWGWWFETLSRPLWRHCNA